MADAMSGQLVMIRSYQEEHIDALFKVVLESIPELAGYETWCHPDYTRDEAAE